ncbi:MAG: glycoside hydrolase family 43 protein [Roseburia sp.]|nr:glycoside hydrolase family 43 protein [Roseburia sp.]
MKKRNIIILAAVGVLCVAGVVAAVNADNLFPEKIDSDFSVSYEGIATNSINAGVSVHDPSIMKGEDGRYYIFGSHMSGAVSDDLRNWESIGNGYSIKNPIFGDLMKQEEPFAYSGSRKSLIPTDDRSWHVWAPDVIYNKAQGKYFMYYCTTSTWNASNLCYGVSDTPEGPYEWQGAFIYSGFSNMKQMAETDVLDYVSEDYAKENYITPLREYNFELYPNAIDPTVFYDKDDRLWMVYGSWSGGIFLLELDPETGLVIHPEADPDNNVDAYYGKRLVGGGHKSIEGPYIMYDAKSDYYYLFVSYGSLTREGGYQIRVYRSKTVNGDYVDMNGKTPWFEDKDHAGFGLKLSGNYTLPSLEQAYMATGHNSAFTDDDGKEYVVFHTRFEKRGEEHEPRVHQMFANEEGWPCVLPYATDGETISESGYSQEEIVGEYYVINQGTKINADIAEPVKLYLSKKGKVYGKDAEGTWETKNNSYYMNITVGEKSYSGVFCKMNDEAGTEVMTFSAVGGNESLWGVKY